VWNPRSIIAGNEKSVSTNDQQFFDLFMLVIGFLIGVTVALFFLARYIAGETQEQYVREDAIYQQQILDRIKPVGHAALPGETADSAAQAATQVAAAEPVAAKLSGPQVFNAACLACHGAGIGGAPKFGDAAAWAPRIKTGIETLKQHAISGFQGNSGYMPPKGGRVDLSDEEIFAAVEYMVSRSR